MTRRYGIYGVGQKSSKHQYGNDDDEQKEANEIRASEVATVYVGIGEAKHYEKDESDDRDTKQDVKAKVSPCSDWRKLGLDIEFVELAKVLSHWWLLSVAMCCM